MSNYGVAEAEIALDSLIDKASAGEKVVITRDGQPVAELRPILTAAEQPIRGSYAWLRAQRDARPGIGMTSVELLNQIYEDPDV